VTAPFDTGLQTERTLLAWRRTCLSLAAGGAVAMRFTATDLGPAAAVSGLLALALAAAGWFNATWRYRRAHRSLTSAEPALGLGGTTVTMVTAATLLLGFLAVALVASHRP
jgi:uncharacterized membrane protein YidH (DUF202 family)